MDYYSQTGNEANLLIQFFIQTRVIMGGISFYMRQSLRRRRVISRPRPSKSIFCRCSLDAASFDGRLKKYTRDGDRCILSKTTHGPSQGDRMVASPASINKSNRVISIRISMPILTSTALKLLSRQYCIDDAARDLAKFEERLFCCDADGPGCHDLVTT